MKQTAAIKHLLPLVKLYPWAIPTIVFLGVLSSVFEGLGISLFIPVLQTLLQETPQSTNQSPLLQGLFQLLQGIPA